MCVVCIFVVSVLHLPVLLPAEGVLHEETAFCGYRPAFFCCCCCAWPAPFHAGLPVPAVAVPWLAGTWSSSVRQRSGRLETWQVGGHWRCGGSRPTLMLSAELVLPLTDPACTVDWLGPASATSARKERCFWAHLLSMLPLAGSSAKHQFIWCLSSAVVPHICTVRSCLRQLAEEMTQAGSQPVHHPIVL